MKSKILIYSIIFLLCLQFLPYSSLNAETLTPAQRAALEEQLAQVQAEQKKAQSALAAAQKKSSSLQNDIDLLAAKIKAAQLNIQAKTLEIKKLSDGIVNKQVEIGNLDKKVQEEEDNIANIFRLLYESDSISVLETLLSNDTISGFLDDSIKLISVQSDLEALIEEFENNKNKSTTEKNVLIDKKNAATDAQYVIQQEQNKIKADQISLQKLLVINKSNEKSYADLVAKKKAEAAAINARLFNLAGGSSPIPFAQAYKYALEAQKKTGIDPAFLLAIMTQESNLGANVGQCLLTNKTTGAGIGKNTKTPFANVMKPMGLTGRKGDVDDFINITTRLGFKWNETPVSCPIAVAGGWGGAMGPAQFIATTWVMFESRIQKALGISGYTNPWNPEHAFLASALYLTDLGAANGGYTAQANAACRYYSGSVCSKSANIASYGASVLNLANKIQTTEIDKLQ